MAIEAELQARSIPHHPIREPDAPHHGALCAIGLAPTTDRRGVSSVLGRLPLLK